MTNNPNSFLNGTLALMRGDTNLAREIFRGEPAHAFNVAEVTSKLYEAIDAIKARTAADLLTQALKKTMGITPPLEIDSEADFLKGVIYVEQIINQMIKDLNANGVPAGV